MTHDVGNIGPDLGQAQKCDHLSPQHTEHKKG